MDPFEVNKEDSFYIYFYSTKPLVAWGLLNPFSHMPITSVLARFVSESVTLFVSSMISLTSIELFQPEWLTRLFVSCEDFTSAFSGNKLTVLCSTLEEVALVKSRGFDAIYVCQNSFVNENVFHVKDDATKRYDAVYNAQYNSFKRHHLARGIPSLALIYAIWEADAERRFSEMKATLPSATLLNGSIGSVDGLPPDYRLLTPEQVNDCLNEAKCGLCLSEVEGNMFASTEYLLAGLPVVSTPNYGGRDKIFPHNYCIMCIPDTLHVATAVRNLIRRTIDPIAVRAETLELIRPHRNRFDELLRSKAKDAGCDLGVIEQRLLFQRNSLPHGFRSGSLGHFLSELSAGGGPLFFEEPLAKSKKALRSASICPPPF